MTLLSTVLAQETVSLTPSEGPFTGAGTLTISGIIQWAIVAILTVAAIIFFFMLILGGIRWIMSGGDKANTEAARNQITAALIGLIIIFAAWAILALLNTIFGINLLGDLTFGSITGSSGSS
jgi:hypothetical protein